MDPDLETDVIVVGSGAAGGMAAYALATSGVKVLMLEAGRDYDPVTETPMFNTPDQAPLRAAGTPDKPQGYFDATVDGAVPGPRGTLHSGGRQPLQLVAGAHARRAHQSLGPVGAAHGPL